MPRWNPLLYTRGSADLGRGRAFLNSMLLNLRRHAKSSVAAVLIGLLVVSFAIFGINDVFAPSNASAIVKAGGREVGPAEFKRLFDNVRQQSQQEAGRPVTVEEAAEQGLVARLLEDLALTESFSEMLSRMGVRPGDKLVADQLGKTRAFFNPVSGRFDRESYQRQLGENGLTEAQFEGFLRDDLAQQHYVAAAVAGLRAPRIYGAVPAVLNGETRTISYFVVDPRIAGVPARPTDAELQAFIKENAAQLQRPETRNLSIVRFSASQLAPTLTVDEAEVRRQYEFRKEGLSTPERRTFVQIPAPSQAVAQQIAARLGAGEAPAVVARAFKVEPVRYDAQPRSAVVDRRAAEAAFGLQPGAVSAPFQGDLNWGVVKLETVTPGQTVTLDQARPEIEAQLRTDLAADRVLDQVQKFEDAVQGGQTFDEAAKTIGVPVTSLPPITAQGTDINGSPTGAPEGLLKAAFELPAGGESDVVDGGRNEFFVVRVDRINPASLPPLEEIRAPLTQRWLLVRTLERARRRADELAAQVKARPLEAVAGSAGAPVNKAVVRRDAGGQTLSRDLVAKVFETKAGQTVVGEHTELGYVVARVDAATVPPPAELARTAEDQRGPVTMDLFQSLGDMARSAARRELKTRVHPDRARSALGLTAAAEAEPQAKS